MKRTIISASVLALAIAGMGVSQAAPSPYKITGGGQYFGDSQGPTGAGNTITFNAIGDTEDAKGKYQQINREAGTGKAQVKERGEIDCVFAMAGDDGTGYGRLGGTLESGQLFLIEVVDGGEGGPAVDSFTITRDTDPSPDNDEDFACNEDEVMEGERTLARGNVQVHKVKSADES